MIMGGFCGQYGPVSHGSADAIEKRLGAHRGKQLTLKSARRGAHPSLLLLLAISIAVAGCGLTGAKTATSANPTPMISVSIVQVPPSPLAVGGTVSVSATVIDDPANAGVDWVPICGSAAAARCGSFSPSHTVSGGATTFTAPNGVPTGSTVALTALSATDKSKAASATVTITSNVSAIVFTLPPPAIFPAGGSVNVAAFVGGDPSNLGVDWKATCSTISGPVNCTSGFQGITHTAPGTPVTFVIPLPADPLFPNIVGGTVTLTAFATADRSFSTSASFIVTGPVSISITQAPPSTVLTNANVPMIATVTNDPTNSGVTWTIELCDAAPCGSWSANSPTVLSTQVASGGTATYIAPGAAENHVLLQAAATASPQNAFATVEVSVTAPISIAITQGVPNNTIAKNGTALVVATVSHDAANAGVDWKVTCGSPGTCGSFGPSHTGSGAVTTFTAPAAVPTGNTVTFTATATSDTTITASETVTVTNTASADSLLTGQWIMLLTGKDQNGGPYVLGGAIGGSGTGSVTSGTLDVEDLGSGAFHNGGTVGVLPAPASTYTIGPDGRGQIHLTLGIGGLNAGFGVINPDGTGTIVLSVVFITPKHALITETDSFGSGTGTLDLQSAIDLAAFQSGQSGLSGSYTLNLAGAEVAGSNPPYFLTGAVSFNSSGKSYRETSYIVDQADHGVIHSSPQTSFSVSYGSQSIPASGKISLSNTNLGVPPTQFGLNLWVIDANHFVVTDTQDLFFVTPSVIISGYMVAQPASPTISGAYAFTEAAKTASPAFVPQPAGGIFTCGSTGVLDVTPLGGTPVSNAPINAACTPPVNGRGLITLSGAGTTGTGISRFAAYPTVDQSLHLIELDGGSGGTSGPSGSGVARPVTLVPPTASNFSGKYAGNFLASTPLGLEGFAGQVDSNGVSMLSGIVDVNSFSAAAPPLGTPSLNAALSGSFTAPGTGRFPLLLTITPAAGQPAPQFRNINPACYVVDANTCLLLGLDATAPGTGILELQNTGL
jgi:hypothetical protein